MEKRSLYDNLDVTMLIVDEVVDGGIVMESDANSLVQRVAVRSEDIPLGEQTVAQVSLIAIFCQIKEINIFYFSLPRHGKVDRKK